jgi:hypothetical protein
MDVFEFVQHLQVMDDMLVATVIIAMFSYVAYPEVKRVACRVRVKANERTKYDRR